VRNRWSDGSFKDLLTLLKNMLSHGNAIPETVFEAKQIICPLSLKVEKNHMCKNDCILYRGAECEDFENDLFVDPIDSIIEKMTVITRTVIEEKTGLKRCFCTFLSFLV
jgi:hypothetical protein